MGKGRASTSSSSSSLESSNSYPNSRHPLRPNGDQLTTDLRLGFGISQAHHLATLSEEPSGYWPQTKRQPRKAAEDEEKECNSATFFVKVYMEGTPIGRKLDLLAHDGYNDLIRTLDLMFNTSIIWAEMEVEDYVQCHVLTYEDKEGDWLMVGDVPWEMFLSSVRRLKITRARGDKG